MADLTSSTVGSTTFGANYEQLVNTQGLSGSFIVATIEKDAGSATEAQLVAVLKALESAGGSGSGSDINGPDAFTIVGFNAATLGTDPAYVLLQGTGTVNTTPVSGYTVTEVVRFTLAV